MNTKQINFTYHEEFNKGRHYIESLHYMDKTISDFDSTYLNLYELIEIVSKIENSYEQDFFHGLQLYFNKDDQPSSELHEIYNEYMKEKEHPFHKAKAFYNGLIFQLKKELIESYVNNIEGSHCPDYK